ncbi:MAG: extracellular solute-binding protein [Treponemataceae bacterium]
MKKIKYIVLFFIGIIFFVSCGNAEDKIAVIWSSRQEFVRYCEIFNASQDKHKIVAHYVKNPSDELLNKNTKLPKPDLVVGCWLKGVEVRKNFSKLNSLIAEDKINPENFYSELLDLGKEENSQLFLPVSFNLPVIIFKKDFIKPSDDFSLSLDELKKISAEYNSFEKKSYTKMGFAPIWNLEFLYLTAKGFNANFEEQGKFFSWDETSLKLAMSAIRKFTSEANTSTKAETDFQFKYLYNNPYSAIMGGRCLFQYLRSDQLLALSHEKMANIDFRWFMFNNKVPLDDEVVYAGIYKKGKNKDTAKAFLKFLFSPETQKIILAETAEKNLSTFDFGIAGGFSSLRTITESVFPSYYPLLLSHLPQSKNFMAPHILPSNWLEIKETTILPYLKAATEIDVGADIEQFQSLSGFINRMN